MPHTHTHTFKVRYYECNASGHLQNAVYLRYMQEAAFAASAAAGYGPSEYDSIRRTWLIRETEIEHFIPVEPETVLEIKTWVKGMRRVISRRAYEFRMKGSDELAARAYSDWVFLNQDSMTPVSIPPGVVTAFCPEGPPEEPYTRRPFPRPKTPHTGLHKFRKQVEWRDIDAMRHLTNAAYLSYTDHCAIRLASVHGWPLSRWEEEGIAFTARRNRIEYRQPAYLDDELEIATWPLELQSSTITYHHAISRVSDGAVIAQVQTLWGISDLATGKAAQFPVSLYEEISKNVSSLSA